MFLFFLLFSVFVSIDAQLDLQQHILTHLNDSIDPCDDFYAHATSALPMSIAEYYINLTARDYDLQKTTTKYSEKIMNISGLNHGPPQKTYWKTIMKICSKEYPLMSEIYTEATFRQCMDSLGRIDYDLHATPLNMKKLLTLLKVSTRSLEVNTQMLHVIEEKGCKYPTQKLETLADLLTEMTIDEVNNTQWLKDRNVADSAIQSLQTVEAYDIVNHFRLNRQFLEDFDVIMDECLQELNNTELADVLFCRLALLYPPRVLTHKSLSGFNAAYVTHLNILIYWPSFNIMAKDENIAAKMSTGLILLHELGHTVYADLVHRLSSGGEYPEALKCVKESMTRVCELFNKTDTSFCSKRADTLIEDAADFSMIMLLNKFAYQLFEREGEFFNREAAQMLFYAFAQTYGHSLTLDVTDEHSYTGDRVNEAARQSPLFAKAFQCKPQDRMVANDDEKCFLSGPNAPTLKSSAIKTELQKYFFENEKKSLDQNEC